MQKVLVCGKREFPKLTSRTFEIKYYTRKYVILLKMDTNTTLDNLGEARTPQWPINIKFLIRPMHRQFNSGCTTAIRKFPLTNFCRDFWAPNSPSGVSNPSRGYFISLPDGPNHQGRWSESFRTSVTTPPYKYMHSTWEPNVQPYDIN